MDERGYQRLGLIFLVPVGITLLAIFGVAALARLDAPANVAQAVAPIDATPSDQQVSNIASAESEGPPLATGQPSCLKVEYHIAYGSVEGTARNDCLQLIDALYLDFQTTTDHGSQQVENVMAHTENLRPFQTWSFFEHLRYTEDGYKTDLVRVTAR